MADSVPPRDAYTTEEITIEAYRMRQEIYVRRVRLAAIFGAGSLLVGFAAVNLVVNRAELYPTFVDGAHMVPLSARGYYRTTVALMALQSLVFTGVALRFWQTRFVDPDLLAALKRLTERGGLSDE